MTERPDLDIPMSERRRRKRYLTLKNVRNVSAVLAVLFIVITVRSELRRGTTDGDYGRLYSRQIPVAAPIEAKKIPVVTEAPIPDQNSADPLLIRPAAREQYLGVTELPQAETELVAEVDTFAKREPLLASTTGKVAIVGNANGVVLVTEEKRKTPVLTGGFTQPQQ